MESIHQFKRHVTGSHGSDLVECASLTVDALGDACKVPGSSLPAMAYLFRRFGPPWINTDPYKRLASYYLTTNDPEVWLSIDIGGGHLEYDVGYMVTKRLAMQFHREMYAPIVGWDRKFERWVWAQLKSKPHETEAEITALREIAGSWRYGNENRIAEAEKAIGEFPKGSRHDPEEWRSGPPLMKRVNQALFDAMRELLRPTSVRDCPFNVLGLYEGDDEWIEPSVYAGLGMPRHVMNRLRRQAELAESK